MAEVYGFKLSEVRGERRRWILTFDEAVTKMLSGNTRMSAEWEALVEDIKHNPAMQPFFLDITSELVRIITQRPETILPPETAIDATSKLVSLFILGVVVGKNMEEGLIGLIEQVERYLEERAEVVYGLQGVVTQNWAAEMLGVFHGRFQWARALHLRESI